MVIGILFLLGDSKQHALLKDFVILQDQDLRLVAHEQMRFLAKAHQLAQVRLKLRDLCLVLTALRTELDVECYHDLNGLLKAVFFDRGEKLRVDISDLGMDHVIHKWQHVLEHLQPPNRTLQRTHFVPFSFNALRERFLYFQILGLEVEKIASDFSVCL